MSELKQTVANKIINIMASDTLTKKEKVILAILSNSWGLRKVTQRDIAQSDKWKEVSTTESLNLETIQRDIRRSIRNLRVMHGLPVLHDERGHFLPETELELETFIGRLEREAKARAASSIETYKSMKDAVGAKSPLFDALGKVTAVGNQIARIERI